MSDLSHYRGWLVDKGYQPSTISATLLHLKAVADEPADLSYRGPHIRRYLLYVSDTRRNPLGKKFFKTMTEGYGLKAAADTKKSGTSVKSTLDTKQWGRLETFLRRRPSSSSDLDRLLLAYMNSPLRITGFLDQTYEEMWRVLPEHRDVSYFWVRNELKKISPRICPKGQRVYYILCPSLKCAYSRMRRRLTAISQQLKIEADLNTLYKTYHEKNGIAS